MFATTFAIPHSYEIVKNILFTQPSLKIKQRILEIEILHETSLPHTNSRFFARVIILVSIQWYENYVKHSKSILPIVLSPLKTTY